MLAHDSSRCLVAGLCGIVLILFCLPGAGPAAAGLDGDPAPPRLPSAQEGRVDATGKFIPLEAGGAGGAGAPKTRAEAEAALQRALDVQPTGAHSFRVGKVSFDKQSRTVTIPARVNTRQSLIEYALVTQSGKVHEALLVTEARPEQVHLACLLLGLVPMEFPGEPGQPLKVPAASGVKVEVTWDKHGPPARFPLAQLVALHNGARQGELAGLLAEGDWFYNGSKSTPQGFLAQQEGSIISLINDPAALINNPRPDRGNDDIHAPNTKLLPPEGTPVRVVLRLPALAEKASTNSTPLK